MGGGAAEAAPRRLGSMAVVILLHVGIVVALIVGLKQGEIVKKIEDIKVAVEKQKVVPKPPPPPPPTMKQPPPPFVPPPEFTIQTETAAPTTAITTQSKVKAPPPPPAIGKRPTVRGSRRGCTDLYPALDKRLGHQGTTQVRFTITTDGDVANAKVSKSSGFDTLDAAAVNCIDRWHWNPATTPGGQPIAVGMALNIKWDLRQE